MAKRLDNSKVASRYAKALFDSTSDSGDVEKVAADLKALQDLLSQVPEFTKFIENPSIAVVDKVQFADQQFGASINLWVLRLIKILMENHRMAIFPQVVEHFSHLLNQRDNVTQAEIVTAVELEAELCKRLQKTLESTFHFSRVDIQNRVEPGLLGGIIVKIQDKVIDGSYIGRLEALRKQVGKV